MKLFKAYLIPLFMFLPVILSARTISVAESSTKSSITLIILIGEFSYGAKGPFGQVIAKSETVENPFQFQTKYYDKETGFSDYGYRYYDPIDGRWVNRDPIGINGGINTYNFVSNNPANGFSGGGSYTSGMSQNVGQWGVNVGVDAWGLIELVYATEHTNAPSIIKNGLKAGKDGLIWFASKNIGGSGASGFANTQLLYDIDLKNVKQIPDCVITGAVKKANKQLKGTGPNNRSARWGRQIGDNIAEWIKKQPEKVFKMRGPGRYGEGLHYVVKSSALKETTIKLLKIFGTGSERVVGAIVNNKYVKSVSGKTVQGLKIGSKFLLPAAIGVAVYQIHTAEDKAREITRQIGGFAGATAGGALGGKGGAGVGTLFGPGPGTVIGGIVGGIGGSIGGFFLGQKVTETIYDVIITNGFIYE